MQCADEYLYFYVKKYRGPLKIALRQNAEEFFGNEENERKHSRKAMLRAFDGSTAKIDADTCAASGFWL